jgi:hypothetical protein
MADGLSHFRGMPNTPQQAARLFIFGGIHQGMLEKHPSMP